MKPKFSLFSLLIFIFLPLTFLSGWSAEIFWHMDKQVYSPGDTANISLELRNTGDTSISVLHVRLSPDWGNPVEKSVNVSVMPKSSSIIGSFQLTIPENATKGWHTVLILLKMRSGGSEFSWEVPMPIEIAPRDVSLNCSSFDSTVSCDLMNRGYSQINGTLSFIYEGGRKNFNVTLNPGELRNFLLQAEGNVTVLFIGDGIYKSVNILISQASLLFMSYRPVFQGYFANITVSVNSTSKASLILEVDGKTVNKAEVERGISTVLLRWLADEKGEHNVTVRICSSACFDNRFVIKVLDRRDLDDLLLKFKKVKEAWDLLKSKGISAEICAAAENDVILLNRTGDPSIFNRTKDEVDECFLYLKSSACNLLGNSTSDPESKRYVEMARKSERPEDFIGNISLVKAENPVYPVYLIPLILLAVLSMLFLVFRRRKRGFRREYSGFKYRL